MTVYYVVFNKAKVSFFFAEEFAGIGKMANFSSGFDAVAKSIISLFRQTKTLGSHEKDNSCTVFGTGHAVCSASSEPS